MPPSLKTIKEGGYSTQYLCSLPPASKPLHRYSSVSMYYDSTHYVLSPGYLADHRPPRTTMARTPDGKEADGFLIGLQYLQHDVMRLTLEAGVEDVWPVESLLLNLWAIHQLALRQRGYVRMARLLFQ